VHERVSHSREGRRTIDVALRGHYTLERAPELWSELTTEMRTLRAGDRVRLDLSHLERADGAAIAVIAHVRRQLHDKGVAIETVGAPGHVQELFRVYDYPGSVPSGPERGPELLTRAGQATAELAREVRQWAAFVARLAVACVGAVTRPRSVKWGDVPRLMERAGADGIPILVIVNFLIGVVTAYESAVQLRRFGATIYVADLVGVSIVRELGPLITAVVVTGRTGAAFAAELATMKVSEEIDALRAMGIDPLRFLVIPRILSVVATVPLLTLVGDAVGMFGGLVVGALALGITQPEYLAETKTTVFASDIFWGVGKSIVFALAIGLIACQQGLAAGGGASGVGRRTTSSVVSILFALIAIDALFAPFFHGK
jgi:phospholipid/cholesterol/gamma-HCH transport system permease protein